MEALSVLCLCKGLGFLNKPVQQCSEGSRLEMLVTMVEMFPSA
jgi:hypothetical protein